MAFSNRPAATSATGVDGGSPGSLAWSFHACLGLRLRRVLRMLATAHPSVLPSAMRNNVGTPVAIISQLLHAGLSRRTPQPAGAIFFLFMTGATRSHYLLQSKLRQGGMGIVYRAIDTRLGRVVALKMIPRDALGREDLRERMLREARAAALLNHPNVCALYDVDESQGFLVMECIEGAALNELLRRGRLQPTEVIDIALQIACGLTAAHEHGIVHRDIKPANILLTRDRQVKITDFGLAKCADETSLTLTGQVLGTPAYMSPEQVRGGTVDERTDIWSFGVVLYELLTGSMPFRGDGISSLLYSIMNDDPEPISASAGPDTSRFQSMVDLCLAKVPQRRYQRMRDVVAALSAFTTRLPVAARDEHGVTQAITVSIVGTPSIAILDFVNRSEDSNLDWLGLAVAETLTSDLRHIASVRVVDRQRVVRAAQQLGSREDSSFADLGLELGVRWLLRGFLEGSIDELRVSAEVLDWVSGSVMAAGQESEPVEEVLSVLDRVITQITEKLGVSLQPGERKRIERPETQALEAYRLYARGRRLFYTFDIAKMDEARETFESAIKLDARYALSWVGLGTIYSFRYIKGTDPRDLDAGIGCFQQAIAVDPDLGEAHTFLAYAYLRQRNFPDGIRAGARAVELEPASTAGHYFLAANYLGSATEARRLEHFPPASDHFAESVRLEPNYQPGLMMLGWTLMLRGEHAHAVPYLAKAADVERTGRFDVMQMVGAQTLLGLVQYRLGDTASAEQSLRRSLDYLRTKSHLYRDLFVSLAHCGIGDIRLDRRLQDEAIDEFTSAKGAIDRNSKGLGMGYCMIRVLTGLARSFQKLGMARESREQLKQATDLYRTKEGYDFHFIWEGCDAQACYDLARACAVMDKRNDAVRWLSEAVAAGWRDRSSLLRDEAMAGLVSSGVLDVDAVVPAENRLKAVP